MPRVEDMFSKVNSIKYFSTLDLHTRYHHIPLNEGCIPKTAFTSPFGKYEYLKVPFGFTQVPVYFQELMNKVLNDLPFTIAYLDDITINNNTAEEHLDHLQQVSHKLCDVEYIKEIEQVPLLHQGNSIFRACPQHYWYKATTFPNSSY